MTSMLAFHNNPDVKLSGQIQQMITRLLDSRSIFTDPITGEAYTTRVSLKPVRLGALSTRGYTVCTLHEGNDRRQVKVHQIIWIAAKGAIPHGLFIGHVNRERAVNHLSNLRLVTASENSRNRRDYTGELNPSAKLTNFQVEQIREQRASGVTYQEISNLFRVSKSLIAAIINGKCRGSA